VDDAPETVARPTVLRADGRVVAASLLAFGLVDGITLSADEKRVMMRAPHE